MSAQNFRTITIPAATSATNPGIIRENINGKVFATVSSSDTFFVRADNGADIEQRQGRYFGNPEAQEFGKLTFYNYTATAVSVTYYAGFEVYKPDSGFSVTAPPTFKHASSYTKGRGALTIASGGGGAQTYNGLDSAKVRKQFFCRSLSTSAGTLLIKDGSGNIMDSLAAGDPTWTLETNGTIVLEASGGAVDAYVGETFYS